MRRERLIVTADSRPQFARGVRMRFDELRGRPVVLGPERIYWPDGVAADILRLCDGKRTLTEISMTLAEEYAAPRETIQSDVLEFVQAWTDLLLLTLTAP